MPRVPICSVRAARACALAAAACLLVLAAAGRSPAPDARRVRVLAAASLTEVVQELARRFEGGRVETSFGGSSALARQIRDGAPADVFVSASPAWIDSLREAGALSGEPIVLARNQLVCIAPRAGPLAARGVRDAAALLEQLAPDGRVAIADEGVPAGEYARSALRRLGLAGAYRARLVGQKDVRAVLNVVERGELDAGFVYASDARVADVALLFAFDPATHPPIEYRAAALRDAASPDAARRLLAFLHSEVARALLVDAGFALP